MFAKETMGRPGDFVMGASGKEVVEVAAPAALPAASRAARLQRAGQPQHEARRVEHGRV